MPLRLKAHLKQRLALLPICAARSAPIRARRPMADPDVDAAAAPPASEKQSGCSGYKQGDDTVDCVFSPACPGKVAFPHGGRCVFCCPDRMLAATQETWKKKHLVSALNKFKKKNDDVYLLAVHRLRSHLSTEQFKAAVTPRNRCIGAGDQLCTRSANGDGGPAWAGKGRTLCSGCEKETGEAEAAKHLAEMGARLADACGRLEASRVQEMLAQVDVAEYCQDSARQELVQDIARELPNEIFEVTLDTAARAALRSSDWNPYRYKSIRTVLIKVLDCMEQAAGAADARPLIRPRPADEASALREALAAWPARDAAATLIQGTALERVGRREGVMKLARPIAEAVPEGVAFAMRNSDGNGKTGLRAAALDAGRAHQMNGEAIKTGLLGMLLELLDKYPDAVAMQNELADLAKTQPVEPTPDCRLTRRIRSILWKAADEARAQAWRDREAKEKEEAERNKERQRKIAAEIEEKRKRKQLDKDKKRAGDKRTAARQKARRGRKSSSSPSEGSDSESKTTKKKPAARRSTDSNSEEASDLPSDRPRTKKQRTARGSAASRSKRAK